MSDRRMPPPGRSGIDPRGPRFAAGITALLLLVDVFLGLTTPTRRRPSPSASLEPAFLLLLAIAAAVPVGRRVAAHGAVGRAVPLARPAAPEAARPISKTRVRRASRRASASSSSRSASSCIWRRAVGAADRRGRGLRRGIPQRGLRPVPRLPALPAAAARRHRRPRAPRCRLSRPGPLRRSRPRMPAVRLAARRPEGGRTPTGGSG